MKIYIYYPKTQNTIIIQCERIKAGPGGIHWFKRGECGFIAFDTANCQVSVISN